jgi:predicted metal-dependent peptidase
MSALLAQARLRACRYWPFASHAILSMVAVPRPGLGTLAVDQHGRLYFDEAALARMDTDQAAGLILHELDHLLKRHHKRAKGLVGDETSKWDAWNHATDASINNDLRAQDIPLPPGLIYPEKFHLPAGLSAEEYFRAISDQAAADRDSQADDGEQGDPQDQDDNQPPEPQDPSEDGQDQDIADSPAADDAPDGQEHAEGQDGPESQGDDPEASGAQEPIASPGDTGQEPGEGDDAQDPAQDLVDEDGGWQGEPLNHGEGGSCSDGRQRPWELGAPDDDNPGLDEADQEQLIHVAAKNALEGAGKGAGGHRRWAEDILDPPLDPAAKLLHLVRRYCDVTVGIGERSYRRPSRRGGDPRMALPSNVAPLPRLTCIVDTSGSVSAEDLGLALGMIRKVLNSFRIRDGIKVVTGDVKGQTKQLCLSNPRRIELTGGGGTDIGAIIAEVLKDRPQPQMILVCTDGWTEWGAEDPGIPIVACLSRPVASLPDCYKPPRWITTLELKGDRS